MSWNPIRLYILSVCDFFNDLLFPNNPEEIKAPSCKTRTSNYPTIDSLHREKRRWFNKVGLLSQQNNDTIKRYYSKQIKLKKVNSKQTTDSTPNKEVADFGYKSITELDSIQKHGEKAQVTDTEYWFLKGNRKQENTNEQIVDKFTESFTKIYQSYCLYMPVLPFFLWLFTIRKMVL
jgi:hypothetical protein